MAWAIPQHSRNQVDKAGRFVTESPRDREFLNDTDNQQSEYQKYLSIVNNWRSSHSYPLNTFQVTLRRKARIINNDAIIAQRIKRLDSIRLKLERQTTQLSQMQDIGGCRAVMPSQRDVEKLALEYIQRSRASRFIHDLKWQKNYIEDPKADGYRSYHLIYAYKGENKYSVYDNLRVEIQIRSRLQHAWATAVEAVGIFTQQALKSNQGNKDWLRFFSLMGSIIAMKEKTALVPGTPNKQIDLKKEISFLANHLKAIDVLKAYQTAINYTNKKDISLKNSKYFLLKLDFEQRRLFVKGFSASQSQEANESYTMQESDQNTDQNSQLVLVSVDSIESLKKAYPNYFLDTTRFSNILKSAISK
jgi:ppGpp synthetase/RelA/SpoT-type nucleotidyltranferase